MQRIIVEVQTNAGNNCRGSKWCRELLLRIIVEVQTDSESNCRGLKCCRDCLIKVCRARLDATAVGTDVFQFLQAPSNPLQELIPSGFNAEEMSLI